MNLAEIRARLAGLNTKTNKRRDLWKPKDKHTIRCLAYPHGDEPFIELGFHYDIGDTRVVLCPRHTSGDDCVICEYADKLKNWNDENGVEKPEAVRRADFEIFKGLQCKERWYIPMVERGHEAEGPKFWAFGKSIYEQMLKMCLDEEMNSDVSHDGGSLVLTDPDCAYDITVDFAQPNNKDGKGNDKSWPRTEIKEKKRPSKLSDKKADSDALLEKVVNISDVYPPSSSEEVEKIFNKFLGSHQEEVKETDADVGTEYEPESAEAPVVGGQSIDDAFGDLVDDDSTEA